LRCQQSLVPTLSRSHAPAWECIPAFIPATVCVFTVDAGNEQTINHRFIRLPGVVGGKRYAIPPYATLRHPVIATSTHDGCACGCLWVIGRPGRLSGNSVIGILNIIECSMRFSYTLNIVCYFSTIAFSDSLLDCIIFSKHVANTTHSLPGSMLILNQTETNMIIAEFTKTDAG